MASNLNITLWFRCLTSRVQVYVQYYIWSCIRVFIYLNNRLIGLVDRVFGNGPGDQGSIPGRIIPKTFKMVFNTYLLNTQHYKVRIEGKVEQSRERSSVLSVVAIEKRAFCLPSTMVDYISLSLDMIFLTIISIISFALNTLIN